MQFGTFAGNVIYEEFGSPVLAFDACCQVQEDIAVLDVPAVFAIDEVIISAAVATDEITPSSVAISRPEACLP